MTTSKARAEGGPRRIPHNQAAAAAAMGVDFASESSMPQVLGYIALFILAWFGPRITEFFDQAQFWASLKKSEVASVSEVAKLPRGWEVKSTPEGKIYYVNHNSATTQWDPPPVDPPSTYDEPAAASHQQQQQQQQQQPEPGSPESPMSVQEDEQPVFESPSAAELRRRRLERLGGGGLNTPDAAENEEKQQQQQLQLQGQEEGTRMERCMEEMVTQKEIYARADEDPDAAEKEVADVCWRQRRDIHAFLRRAASQLKIEKIEPNPAAMPGETLYERFKEAHNAASDKSIRLVFHGTGASNIEQIAREGLDPSRRSGQAYGPGEYFGTDLNTSLRYCRGGRQVLVFAVLLDPSGLTTSLGGDASLPQQNGREQQPQQPTTTGLPPHAAPLGRSTSSFSAPPAWGRREWKADSRTTIGANGEITSGEGLVDEAKSAVGNGVVVVHRVEHQLPLFVITFDDNAPPTAPGQGGFAALSGHGLKLGREELPAKPEQMPPASSRVGPATAAAVETPTAVVFPAPAPAATSPAATVNTKQRVFKCGDTGSVLELPGGSAHDRKGQAGKKTDISASERQANLDASRRRYCEEQKIKKAERRIIEEEKRKVAEQRAEFAARQGKARTSVASTPSLFPKEQLTKTVEHNPAKIGSRTRTLREQRKAREAELAAYSSPDVATGGWEAKPQTSQTKNKQQKQPMAFKGFQVDEAGKVADEMCGMD